jgi:hypothetical protein
MPVIYANDNFGHWRSDFQDVYAHCTRKGARGRKLCRILRPQRRDYFILKPRHSAFFATSLMPMLEHLGVNRLILAGIATNLCVLFTAHDAHMRHYEMIVLSDCCAAESDFDHNLALGQLEQFCGAVVCRSSEYQFRERELTRRHRPEDPGTIMRTSPQIAARMKGDVAMAKYSKKASKKVERAMHERKRGTLRSGRSGKKVTSRKQAIAIGLSEARRAGAKVPKKSSAKKRSKKK